MNDHALYYYLRCINDEVG